MLRIVKLSTSCIALLLLLNANSYAQGLIPAASPTPSANQTAPQEEEARAPQTARERRERAYAKIMEGERLILALRTNPTDEATRAAAQAAFQEAARLDPTIAEAHTALAELSLFFPPQDFDASLREASEAVRIDRNNFGAHKILSRVYAIRSGLREANVDRNAADLAVRELREVIRLDSNDSEAWGLLAELYARLGKTDDAIEAARRWAEVPEPVDARIFQIITGHENSPAAANARLAQLLLEAGQARESIAAIRAAISLDPENEEYAELLGQAIEAAGSDDNAAIAELQSLVAASPKNLTLLKLLAHEQARAGQVEQAAQTLRAGIQAAEGNTEQQFLLRVSLAQMYADALRYNEAVSAYEALLQERGITNKPLTTDAERRYATAVLSSVITLQKNTGHADDARATIERLRTLLGADSAAADELYVQLLRDEGQRREALQAVKLARQHHADDRALVWLEAETLADLGRIDEAATLARSQLRGSLEDLEVYLRLASLYTQARRGREAVEAARKAIELVPQGRDDLMIAALVTLASAQERAGDARGAEDSLKRVLGMDPNDATALNNMGYFLLERNERLEEALKMIERAVRAEPTNSSFLDSLGWAYFKLGKLEEAERHLTEAARRDATSATIQEHLGDILERRGKADEARTAWQKALSLATDSEDVARIKAKLSGRARNRD